MKIDYSNTTPGFCPLCGSILPTLKAKGNVFCYTCKAEHKPEAFQNMQIEYTIQFNSSHLNSQNKSDKAESTEEGPVVERICPKCKNDKMSYATLQLRSADEGQTIFFTCTKCGHKETENS